MRNIKIVPEEYYHIFNRGVNKQTIFHNKYDYFRLLFLVLYLQSPIKFPQLSRVVKKFVQSLALDRSDEKEIIEKRTVELVAFCIMPNHFHLIVREIEEGGIAEYMQRVQTAYSKYYNLKYEKSGHVFQGTYKSVHIENDRQMKYLSAYIHRNPREINTWLNKEYDYPWSSAQDYLKENRWRDLLVKGVVLDEFKNKDAYRKFLDTSTAKIIEEEFEYL